MSTKSDFMAAEEIKAILGGREKAEQERIMRWVNESLGIAPTPATYPGTSTFTLPGSATPQPHQSHPTSPIHHVKNIKSFVSERQPKNDVQFAAVAAYFYRFEAPEAERKETIVPKDLNEAGRLARGYSFKNAQQTLSNASMLGYLDRAARGEFKLNAVGENLVVMTLPGAKHEENGKKTRPLKRKKRSKQPKSK